MTVSHSISGRCRTRGGWLVMHAVAIKIFSVIDSYSLIVLNVMGNLFASTASKSLAADYIGGRLSLLFLLDAVLRGSK
jgi:hypothetical protein